MRVSRLTRRGDIQATLGRTRRKRLRIRHPGDPRTFCEAITERHTKCKNYARTAPTTVGSIGLGYENKGSHSNHDIRNSHAGRVLRLQRPTGRGRPIPRSYGSMGCADRTSGQVWMRERRRHGLWTRCPPRSRSRLCSRSEGTVGMKREQWPCRVCGVHVRQQGDSGTFVNVVVRGRIVGGGRTWRLPAYHRRPA